MTQTTPPPALAHGETSARGRDGRPLRERVEELTKRLRAEHDEFERAAQSWTPEAEEKKKEARKARETTLKEIQDLLASEGEGERATRIERLPFARKLIELEAWVGITSPRTSQPAPAPRASGAPPAPSPSLPHPPLPAPLPAPPFEAASSTAAVAAPVWPEAPAPSAGPASDRKEPPPPASSAPALQAAAALDRMPDGSGRHEAVLRTREGSSLHAIGRHPIVRRALDAIARHRTIGLRVGAAFVAVAVVTGVWIFASHPAPPDSATPPLPAAASVLPVPADPPASQADLSSSAASATPETPVSEPETSPAAPTMNQPPGARGSHPHEAPTNPY
jgi:hypothetical protein